MTKKLLYLCLAVFILISYAFSQARDTSKLPKYKDEVLVVYKAEFTQADIDLLVAKYSMKAKARNEIIAYIEGIHNITKTRTYLPQNYFVCYKIPKNESIESVILALKAEPVIESVQPNYIFYTQTASYTPLLAGPNDNYYSVVPSQWYINQIRADKAYAELLATIVPVRNVIVAVIDTGVDIDLSGGHEDLRGVTVTGKNILNPTQLPYDDEGHGTHVAGIIVASTNNSLGISSISGLNYGGTFGVKVMPIKVLDSLGEGTDADIYTGIVWAADNGADIINMSLGGTSADAILQNGVNYAYNKGCLIVAAAGNSNDQTFYPAAYSNVMAVAASDMLTDTCGNTYDVKADFSNWGKIDIAAPGVNILSTSNENYSSYTEESGTSFSSPIVAAVAALIKMKYPDYTATQLKTILEQSADDDYHRDCSAINIGHSGYDKYFGWGRVNAFKALNLEVSTVSNPDIKTYNWPNPFSPDSDNYTNIVFTIDKAQKIFVCIYDGGGELVWDKTLQSFEVLSGIQNTVKWNGKNKDNKRVANGVYFYLIKTNGVRYGKNKIVVFK
ncbi:MAG: S8 family serine peptidase [bacterium]